MRIKIKIILVIMTTLIVLNITTGLKSASAMATQVPSDSSIVLTTSKLEQEPINPTKTKLINDSEINWDKIWKSPVWNAVGALGQWVGAIATSAAVIVALKTARDASTIRVKVDASHGFLASSSGTSEAMVFFSACNVGQRVVLLTSMGIILPNNRQLVFPEDSRAALPANLEESQETKFWVPAKNLAETLKSYGYTGGVKLRVYFSDSHNVRHWKKWKFYVNAWSK